MSKYEDWCSDEKGKPKQHLVGRWGGTCPIATLSTAKSTWTGLHGDRLVTTWGSTTHDVHSRQKGPPTTKYVTNFTEYSTSWKAASSSTSQQIPHISWKPWVHYCAHLSQSWARLIHSMPFNPISLRFILISFHLCLHLAGASFPVHTCLLSHKTLPGFMKPEGDNNSCTLHHIMHTASCNTSGPNIWPIVHIPYYQARTHKPSSF